MHSSIRWITALALGLGACGHSSPAPMAPAKPEVAATGSLLKLAEITFTDHDNPAIKVHADGGVEIMDDNKQWKPVGKLSTDGKFVVTDGSTGQLDADGTFKTPDGPAPFKLDGDALVAGDKRVTIDDKGSIVGGNPGADTIKITGATDVGTKRTALLILGVLLTSK